MFPQLKFAFQNLYHSSIRTPILNRPDLGRSRAPGRVNLIGEHTDYNDGFVLPMAIDRAVWIALTPIELQSVQAYSLDFNEDREFPLSEVRSGPPSHGKKTTWIEYLKGVAWAMNQAGHQLHGWKGVIAGDVPAGAGLSSSAALEIATARAFSLTSGIDWDVPAMAEIGRQAENGWVGVHCGIMDQMISAMGKAGHALLIDCRSLKSEAVPLPAGTAVVVLDTATRRGLAGSAYNDRRQQCDSAAAFFKVQALRDVSIERFQAQEDQLEQYSRRRARHVISENTRTLEAAEAMRRGDAVKLGELMNASHASLRDDFEVSSKDLDDMVSCGQEEPTCLGIRLTGAGFGGCAVALVRTEGIEDFTAAVSSCYSAKSGLRPNIYVCTASNGAEVIE